MRSKIVYTKNISETISEFLNEAEFSEYAILVDENTAKLCLPLLNDDVIKHIIEMPSGEEYKTIETAEAVWEAMTNYQLDRQSLLINLGGGVISDLGGFCAATFKRGIRFINIPTTLLAMTDAAIGGKSGVNFDHYKNHIGVFQNAEQVLIDPVFLETLNSRELKSGYAEVLKHAVISGQDLWEKTQFDHHSNNSWLDIIRASSSVKMNIVAEDFRESGLRKALNFGHSIGHQIEAFSMSKGQRNKLHGEAIAEGMMIETILARHKNLIDDKESAHILNRIKEIFQPETVSGEARGFILDNLIQDKKNTSKSLNFSLPLAIGSIKTDVECEMKEIGTSIDNYNQYLK